jgi:hypothetical protein
MANVWSDASFEAITFPRGLSGRLARTSNRNHHNPFRVHLPLIAESRSWGVGWVQLDVTIRSGQLTTQERYRDAVSPPPTPELGYHNTSHRLSESPKIADLKHFLSVSHTNPRRDSRLGLPFGDIIHLLQAIQPPLEIDGCALGKLERGITEGARANSTRRRWWD